MTGASAIFEPQASESMGLTCSSRNGNEHHVDWGLANYFRLLFDRIMQAWPDKAPRHPAVGFTSCRTGEGVSTICRQLTTAAAQKLQRPVLLVQTNRDGACRAGQRQGAEKPGLYDVLSGQTQLADAIVPGAARWAFLLGPGTSAACREAIFRRDRFGKLLDLLKREFHMIVVDLPPCQSPSDCFAMASTLDGVVIVIEAERVRSPIIAKARDHLFQAGANVLGVILNKRRNHVPEWLYRRL